MPALHSKVTCDVAVIGGGVTGALAAHALVEAGQATVLLDKRGVAAGSTAASTALVQYEIDVPLHRLIRMRGRRAAVRSYRLCQRAIDQIEEIASRLDGPCRFARLPSLFLARRPADVAQLRREYGSRRKSGFDVELLDRSELGRQYSLQAPAALLSAAAAQIDPVAFTQLLLEKARARGLRIYAPAQVQRVDHGRDRVTLTTRLGYQVVAKRVVMAAGYESMEFLRRPLIRLRSTYALVTQPLAQPAWRSPCVAWETGRPYFYLRSTDDGRMMIGGLDEDFAGPERRDALIEEKSRQLERKLNRVFPRQRFTSEYRWAGTFGDTKDGLPFIGSLPGSPRVLYALCYGANGINFAMIASGLARDWARGQRNRDRALFRLDR